MGESKSEQRHKGNRACPPRPRSHCYPEPFLIEVGIGSEETELRPTVTSCATFLFKKKKNRNYIFLDR